MAVEVQEVRRTAQEVLRTAPARSVGLLVLKISWRRLDATRRAAAGPPCGPRTASTRRVTRPRANTQETHCVLCACAMSARTVGWPGGVTRPELERGAGSAVGPLAHAGDRLGHGA